MDRWSASQSHVARTEQENQWENSHRKSSVNSSLGSLSISTLSSSIFDMVFPFPYYLAMAPSRHRPWSETRHIRHSPPRRHSPVAAPCCPPTGPAAHRAGDTWHRRLTARTYHTSKRKTLRRAPAAGLANGLACSGGAFARPLQRFVSLGGVRRGHHVSRLGLRAIPCGKNFALTPVHCSRTRLGLVQGSIGLPLAA